MRASSSENRMVQQISEVVREYKKSLQEIPFVPRPKYKRGMLREEGETKKIFLTFLVCDQAVALQFLKGVGLLRSKMQCNTCGREMTWSAQPHIPEECWWRCRGKVAGTKCSESRSIKHGSWFQLSNLTFLELLHLITTSCAANLPTKSKKNMASVQIPSLTGACSAGKPC